MSTGKPNTINVPFDNVGLFWFSSKMVHQRILDPSMMDVHRRSQNVNAKVSFT